MDELYGLADDERLSESIEDVVERVLDDAVLNRGESFDETADRLEWPLKIYTYRRKVVGIDVKTAAARVALDLVLERLDEEYSDPDGDGTTPTATMCAAAATFVEAVTAGYAGTAGYFVWQCEPTGDFVEITREQAKEYV